MIYLYWFILIILLGFTIYVNFNYIKDKKKFTLSFKESLSMTGLPIIVLKEKDLGNLHLLVDSGSDSCIINAEELTSHIELDTPDDTVSINGTAGIASVYGEIKLELLIKDKVIKQEFVIADINTSFNALKERTGIKIHGIIGSNFFDTYGSIIDYKDYVIYNTK